MDLEEIRAEYWSDESEARRILRETLGAEYDAELYTAGRWLGEQLIRKGITDQGANALCMAGGALAASLCRDGFREPWMAAAIVLDARSEWPWMMDRARVARWLEHASISTHSPDDRVFSALGEMLGRSLTAEAATK
jgi:hypothetical protein